MSNNITPKSNELFFEDGQFIVSKTDLKGRITYGNELFIKISGYKETELLHAPHSILRHPDMPKAVFKLLWDYVQKGDEIFAFVKNMAKDGSFYWVKAQVTPSMDDKGAIIGYHSVRRKPSRETIKAIEPLYAEMLRIEKNGSVEKSTAYLLDVLAKKGVTYAQFVFNI